MTSVVKLVDVLLPINCDNPYPSCKLDLDIGVLKLVGSDDCIVNRFPLEACERRTD